MKAETTYFKEQCNYNSLLILLNTLITMEINFGPFNKTGLSCDYLIQREM